MYVDISKILPPHSREGHTHRRRLCSVGSRNDIKHNNCFTLYSIRVSTMILCHMNIHLYTVHVDFLSIDMIQYTFTTEGGKEKEGRKEGRKRREGEKGRSHRLYWKKSQAPQAKKFYGLSVF